MANSEFNGVACGNDYTDAATIKDVYIPGGGVFEVDAQPAKYKLQYGGQGVDHWTPEAIIGTGGGSIPEGVTGIAFKNSVAGSVAIVSALIRPRTQPHLALSFPSPIIQPSAMQLIQTQTLSAPAASFVFGVPSTFTHLQLRFSLRSTVAAVLDNLRITLNGDVGLDYDNEDLDLQNVGLAMSANLNTGPAVIGTLPGATAPAGIFAPGRIEIENYTSAVAHKVIETWSVTMPEAAANQLMRMNATLWHPGVIVAVSTISLNAAGGNFDTGSVASLYGIT